MSLMIETRNGFAVGQTVYYSSVVCIFPESERFRRCTFYPAPAVIVSLAYNHAIVRRTEDGGRRLAIPYDQMFATIAEAEIEAGHLRGY